MLQQKKTLKKVSIIVRLQFDKLPLKNRMSFIMKLLAIESSGLVASVAVTENVSISVVEEGPLRATLKVERDFEGSHIVQYISLTDGVADDRIEVSNEIDWVSENAMLKAHFPTSLSNEKTAYDLGCYRQPDQL